MKRLPAMLVISGAVLLFSCNNEPKKEEEKAAADTTVAEVSPPPVVEKPAFKPFKVVIIQHKVKDFQKSQAEYFKRDSLRESFGISHYLVSRNLKDSATVFVMDKIEDVDKAKAFFTDAKTKDLMKKAGVSSPPGYTYGEVVWINENPTSSNEGLSVTHHVKDYAAWLKAFDAESRATRSSNGLVDHAIVRNLYDTNTVSIIFDVTDMPKAKARLSSPELKKIMADAGVDGPPTIRWFVEIK